MSADRDIKMMSVESMRDAFDRTFAVAPTFVEDSREGVLTIQAGGDPYALRLSQVASLFADKRVTWLPGPVRELLGVVAVRGAVLPVYDLAALLGYPATTTPRWFVTAAVSPVALAFDRFDGHRRVAREDISAARAESHTEHVREVAGVDGTPRLIVDLSSVVDAIAALAQRAPAAKE